MNSDISKRISAWSDPNRKLASVRAISVCPRRGSRKRSCRWAELRGFETARERRIARASAEMAHSSCEIHALVAVLLPPQQLLRLSSLNAGHRNAVQREPHPHVFAAHNAGSGVIKVILVAQGAQVLPRAPCVFFARLVDTRLLKLMIGNSPNPCGARVNLMRF